MIWQQVEKKRKKRDTRKMARVNIIPKIVVTSEKTPNIIDNMKKSRKKK